VVDKPATVITITTEQRARASVSSPRDDDLLN
jgi:hypothetical protein